MLIPMSVILEQWRLVFMKRSQMEILGLAVVFILLIFGLLIYLRLSVNDEGSKDDFVQQIGRAHV